MIAIAMLCQFDSSSLKFKCQKNLSKCYIESKLINKENALAKCMVDWELKWLKWITILKKEKELLNLLI